MKQKSAVLCLALCFVFCVSCIENRAPKNTMTEKEIRLKQYSDSVVNLSFKGIVLAAPFKQTMNRASKAGQIKKLQFGKDGSATCRADITLPNRETPLSVDVKVTSYQDTITSFLILSNVYETYPALIALYKDKYNPEYATTEDNCESWGDAVMRSGNYSYIWTFKNQTLRVTDFYSEKRENYVKNPNMRSPEYRYGVKYTKFFQAVSILYSDIKQCAKVEAIEMAEREKELAIEKEQKRQQQIRDSLKAAQLKQQALNQDI